MATETEAGNYATYQAESGKWYYHPTDRDWLAFNRNTGFSRAYPTEAEAMEDAELEEQMDADRFDGVIFDSIKDCARP